MGNSSPFILSFIILKTRIYMKVQIKPVPTDKWHMKKRQRKFL